MTRVREWGLQDRPLNTVQFESPSHMGTLLCGLNTLRTRGWLLDVTLLAEGEAFQAHRAVLASCSDYFRAMFTDAMRESRQSEICLNGVTAAGIRLLLDYAYTSRLALNLANIQDVLSAASHVQVVAVVEACSTYLQAQLDLENCVDLATIAETYSLGQLRRRVYQLMCGRLREFSHCPDFQRLSQQQLEHLLDCDFPVDCDEGEVLRCALRWASWGDSPRRLGALPRLLARVHFAEIPSPQRDLALESLSGLDYKEWDLCYRLISEPSRQLSHLKISANPSASTVLVNSRGMELAIVKVGGFGIAGITNEITYFLRSAGKWRHLTTIPHVEQCNFGTAVLDNELYVVGGCFNQSLEENIHPFGFRYSPRSNKWSTMAPMQRERCRFSLNVLGGHLYAIGGVSEVDDAREDRDVSACERYDPATDCWESVRPLPLYCTQHAGASWGSSKLFVSGGLAHDSVHGMLHCYDSCSDSWACLQPMRMLRADHVMITVGDKLYACGGWAEDPDSGNRILVDSIDVYDVAADCWEVVTHVPTPRYHAGIVGVASKIYFVGGFRGDTLFDRATAVIECYDLDTGLWTTCDKYPREIWEHTCITLYIPRCREDMEVMTAPESPT